MTDSEIIELVLSGEKEPYAELVRRYQDRIIGLCFGILNDPTLAEDAAQDIFVKVFRLLQTFRGKSSFSTWLYRIATNHCLDLRRKMKRQKTDSLDDLQSETREGRSGWLGTRSEERRVGKEW